MFTTVSKGGLLGSSMAVARIAVFGQRNVATTATSGIFAPLSIIGRWLLPCSNGIAQRFRAPWPPALNILRIYGPVVPGASVSVLAEFVEPIGFRHVFHVGLQTGSLPDAGGRISSIQDRVISAASPPPRHLKFTYFGGDCCVFLDRIGQMLGVVAVQVRFVGPHPNDNVTSHTAFPWFHRFYTLQSVHPFRPLAVSPLFCIDGAGSLSWHEFDTVEQGHNIDDLLGSNVAKCEMRQLVRGLSRSPGSNIELGDILLTVGVNRCESSIVRLWLPSILALLRNVSASVHLDRVPRIIHQVWMPNSVRTLNP